jgi:hypothetical protein
MYLSLGYKTKACHRKMEAQRIVANLEAGGLFFIFFTSGMLQCACGQS